jgi:hypothetical protein
VYLEVYMLPHRRGSFDNVSSTFEKLTFMTTRSRSLNDRDFTSTNKQHYRFQQTGEAKGREIMMHSAHPTRVLTLLMTFVSLASSAVQTAKIVSCSG